MARSMKINMPTHINPNTLMPLENQLLTTKLFLPIRSGIIIPRPHLVALLDKSLKYPFALVSAPAGFGKTTLLATWTRSLQAHKFLVAWLSLDEEDNEPRLFWTYLLSALDRQQPERFTPLLTLLQSPQAPPFKSLVAALINLLAENTEHFLLILDDYQMITEQQVHTTFSYLLDHLPAQLQIILATRADPPLPLSQLRARNQMLEIRTDQLRCTVEETSVLFYEVMHTQLPDETIQEITTRTEGWLVGLQLLGLSLAQCTDPATLLQEVCGDQRYILDYLTQEVLQRQYQDIQTFLLSTCILERLTASLCNAVMQTSDSQQMLERLEQSNLFVVSLDSKRQWYRYHALFAEALRYRLEETHEHLMPALHQRASLWYAEQGQITQAILHALKAHEWQGAADLIESKTHQLVALTWGGGEHKLILLQQWLKQLPIDVVRSRPRLCLACAELLWTLAPSPMLEGWLNMAIATLTASLNIETHDANSQTFLTQQARQEQENLLGEVTSCYALVQSFDADGDTILLLCQQALALLSEDNFIFRSQTALVQLIAFYNSSANDSVASVECGLQALSLAQIAEQTTLAINHVGATASSMIGAGRLHEAYQLTNQAIHQLQTQAGEPLSPLAAWPAVFQAYFLCEWNQLDAARALVEEAIVQYKQIELMASPVYVLWGYIMLLHICLSGEDINAALSALQEIDRIGVNMNQPTYITTYSFLTTNDQVRLWLACGELDHAIRWAEELSIREQPRIPIVCEREGVACVRVLLAKGLPAMTLERLEPLVQRATIGQRWGHVIEMRLLQALAYHMLQQKTQALDVLSQAVQLAKPEGYIRSFVDEGATMEALLYQLRKQNRKDGPTPYLDTILAAFQKQKTAHSKGGNQTLPQPLSKRELQVLQLLAHGSSNVEIAQKLVITVDTVKRHASHIFSKLGVQNRLQAVNLANDLNIIDKQ